jgi:hypothetical protein
MTFPHSPQPGPRPAPPPGGFRPAPPPGGFRPGPAAPGSFRPGQPTARPDGPAEAHQPAGAERSFAEAGAEQSFAEVGADPPFAEAAGDGREPEDTGHPAVDAALRSLANAARLAPGEQIAAYEAAHQVFQETLASIDH